jgi:hypothetical protein
VKLEAPLRERANCVFLGTNVRSGIARCLVVRTGPATEFGAVAHRLAEAPPETAFDRGLRPSYLLTAPRWCWSCPCSRLICSAGVPGETLLFSVASPWAGRSCSRHPQREPGPRARMTARRNRAAPQRHENPGAWTCQHGQDRHSPKASCSWREPTQPGDPREGGADPRGVERRPGTGLKNPGRRDPEAPPDPAGSARSPILRFRARASVINHAEPGPASSRKAPRPRSRRLASLGAGAALMPWPARA